jgi:hypothetical protein
MKKNRNMSKSEYRQTIKAGAALSVLIEKFRDVSFHCKPLKLRIHQDCWRAGCPGHHRNGGDTPLRLQLIETRKHMRFLVVRLGCGELIDRKATFESTNQTRPRRMVVFGKRRNNKNGAVLLWHSSEIAS